MLITESLDGLNPEEALAKIKEDNRLLMAKHRVPDQDMLADREAARGRMLDWTDLLRLIHTANPNLIVTDGGPGCSNPKTVALGRLKNGQYSYIAGFRKEPLPEFTSIIEDDAGLIKDVIHGWREVLLNLLKSGAIKWDKVLQQFGDANGQRSSTWKRSTAEFRA